MYKYVCVCTYPSVHGYLCIVIHSWFSTVTFSGQGEELFMTPLMISNYGDSNCDRKIMKSSFGKTLGKVNMS